MKKHIKGQEEAYANHWVAARTQFRPFARQSPVGFPPYANVGFADFGFSEWNFLQADNELNASNHLAA